MPFQLSFAPYLARRSHRRLKQRLSAQGDFDAVWYRSTYPDVAASGFDPFTHYMIYGWQEGRFPNPLFDSRFYLSRNPAVAAAQGNPLVHYVDVGAAEDRDPNPWFDTRLYRRRFGAALANQTPVAHYLSCDLAARFNPCTGFDAAAYRAERPELTPEADAYLAFLHDAGAVCRSCIGDCVSTYINGWAFRDIGPPVQISIRVNGALDGTLQPWLPRPDVAAHCGKGDEPLVCGFFYTFSRRLRAGDIVEALDEGGAHLSGSPRVYAVPPLSPELGLYEARAAIAHRFLRGEGLEIGAFTQPTDVSADVNVAYYDRYPAQELRRFYREEWGRPLIEPSFHGDAETLTGLPADVRFDFVVANHVIEHLEDPIRFLKTLAAALNPGGRIMLAAPNKRLTFDAARESTPFSHLKADHLDGAAQSRRAHYLEWAERVDKLRGEAAKRRADALDRENFSIHFHVWDEIDFSVFLANAIKEFQLPLRPLLSFVGNGEIVVVLEKELAAA